MFLCSLGFQNFPWCKHLCHHAIFLMSVLCKHVLIRRNPNVCTWVHDLMLTSTKPKDSPAVWLVYDSVSTSFYGNRLFRRHDSFTSALLQAVSHIHLAPTIGLRVTSHFCAVIPVKAQWEFWTNEQYLLSYIILWHLPSNALTQRIKFCSCSWARPQKPAEPNQRVGCAEVGETRLLASRLLTAERGLGPAVPMYSPGCWVRALLIEKMHSLTLFSVTSPPPRVTCVCGSPWVLCSQL